MSELDGLLFTIFGSEHIGNNGKLCSKVQDHGKSGSKPLVTLTYAQSLDAKIAGKGGKQVQLSGNESAAMTHRYDYRLWLSPLLPVLGI